MEHDAADASVCRYFTGVFAAIDVSAWRLDEVDEQLGTKEKYWLRDSADERWLFKQVRSHKTAELGEDWAEKVVEQVGLHLGLPMARVELAVRRGQRGIISKNFVPRESRLEHGNELLVRVDGEYDKGLARQNSGYTVQAIRRALADAGPPAAYVVEKFTAFDVFAGYLLLDAWVAGRDRHHENWAVIAGPSGRTLAPSFDHGNALGFQESPDNQKRLVADPAKLAKWAERGTSHHFAGRPTLVAVAREALLSSSDAARGVWMSRLEAVSNDDVVGIISQVPSELMSEPSRNFCSDLLTLNKRRLSGVD